MRNEPADSESSRAYTKWIIYVLVLAAIFLINCVLTYHAFIGVSFANKVSKTIAFLPTPLYLLETFLTRSSYIAIFSGIKGIRAALTSSTKQEHVVQLSRKSIIKIIFMLSMFTVQQAIISVKCFVYGTIDVHV